MINIEFIRDKIVKNIGLMTALDKMLWTVSIPQNQRVEFNAILAISDCLAEELNALYELVRGEV